ncbi:MAG: HAMP domain-containing protein [Bradyrhizobium sp.]|uniref:methyl-accepting chemotaxis protein n=1 Tax=Bradyrhizobium sp. TaxID=376 RepID=UPI0025C514B4|nr:methyl-accepting chemotaxis protein [Bradyrhizobium sp.]MBI5262731.1 HAMP domain-containing protein [Bradyrhizobium sp.]
MSSMFRSLKVQAGIAATVMFAAGVVAAGVLSFEAMSRTLEQGHAEAVAAGASVGLETLSGVGNRMNVYADILARSPELALALQQSDKAGLETFAVREFKAIHEADKLITTLEVTDSKGVVVQRGHNPSKRGDDKSNHPQVRGALGGKAIRGLTVSPTTGEPAEDSVKPVLAGNKVVGTLKVGSYFNQASANELKSRTGLEVVFITRGKAAASTFGKDVEVSVPPEAIKGASAGSSATLDVLVQEKPFGGRLVYVPSDVGEGMTIAFLSGLSDIEAAKWAFARSLLLKCALALVVILPLAFFGAHVATRQLLHLAAAMRELAAGKLDVALPGLGRRDEVGDIAKAVEDFKIVAAEKAKAEQEKQRQLDEQLALEQRNHVHKIANDFEETLGGIIHTVSSNASVLESAASKLTATAEGTHRLSTGVAASSEEASASVSSVAQSATEMAATVQKVAEHVARSRQISDEAVSRAGKADERIADLSRAASRIGDVVQLITSIAAQTNLLALNATIEAARAGDAGRGFAIVAQEVKALAAQTAKATEEIDSHIQGMQTATTESVAAIKDVSATIGQISAIAEEISAAVQAQNEMTGGIASNVEQAARGTAEVASNIAKVNAGAVETGSASTQVLEAARSLTSESERLRSAVEGLLATVRAA